MGFGPVLSVYYQFTFFFEDGTSKMVQEHLLLPCIKLELYITKIQTIKSYRFMSI